MTTLLKMIALLMWTAAVARAGQIDQVEFKPASLTGEAETRVEIKGSGLSGFVQEQKKDPPELVLTFDNSTLADTARKNLDAAGLKSKVMQVSSYSVPGAIPQAKVVVDFSKAASYTIDESDQKLVIKIQDNVAQPSAVAGSAVSVKTVSSAAEDDPVEVAAHAQEQKFTGTPITLKLKDADVHEVLRLVSETSGFNIVIHPSVQGRLTLSLEQVPWDQALEVVLTTLKLAAERSQSVLRVMPREMLLQEKQAELEAKKVAASSAPRITRIFPINYADPQSLSTLLASFATAQNSGPGSSGIPTTIIVDQNTQSLIVRDAAENVERIRKMIQLLDVQTPQVLIEGKVVEASNDFAKSITGSIGAGGNQLAVGMNTSANGLIGTPTLTVGDAGTGAARLNQGFTIFDRPILLSAVLSMGEKESRAKVVSSPRTVVLSGKSATINQAKSVAVTSNSISNGVISNSLQTISANTRLSVTPRVTNDGSVFMRLDLSRDILNTTNPNAPVAEPRTMSTEVIVDSGSTLVIGGILNLDESYVAQGVPFLRKIPLFGWLFGSENSTNTKSEVMFFVTPRVLNPRRSGATVSEDAPVPVPAEKL